MGAADLRLIRIILASFGLLRQIFTILCSSHCVSANSHTPSTRQHLAMSANYPHLATSPRSVEDEMARATELLQELRCADRSRQKCRVIRSPRRRRLRNLSQAELPKKFNHNQMPAPEPGDEAEERENGPAEHEYTGSDYASAPSVDGIASGDDNVRLKDVKAELHVDNAEPDAEPYPMCSHNLLDAQRSNVINWLAEQSLPAFVTSSPSSDRADASSGRSEHQTSSGTQSVSSNNMYHSNSKRSLIRTDKFDGDDDNENSDREGPSKRSRIGLLEIFPTRQFACPYYKRNPSKHQVNRSCRFPGFPTIPRLK
jgi:hypothetical protein